MQTSTDFRQKYEDLVKDISRSIREKGDLQSFVKLNNWLNSGSPRMCFEKANLGMGIAYRDDDSEIHVVSFNKLPIDTLLSLHHMVETKQYSIETLDKNQIAKIIRSSKYE